MENEDDQFNRANPEQNHQYIERRGNDLNGEEERRNIPQDLVADIFMNFTCSFVLANLLGMFLIYLLTFLNHPGVHKDGRANLFL